MYFFPTPKFPHTLLNRTALPVTGISGCIISRASGLISAICWCRIGKIITWWYTNQEGKSGPAMGGYEAAYFRHEQPKTNKINVF
jgi:hypothetical protein